MRFNNKSPFFARLVHTKRKTGVNFAAAIWELDHASVLQRFNRVRGFWRFKRTTYPWLENRGPRRICQPERFTANRILVSYASVRIERRSVYLGDGLNRLPQVLPKRFPSLVPPAAEGQAILA